jgi:YgiT-type zinc finger domain-containing protein
LLETRLIKKLKMVEGRCMKCKKQVEIKNAQDTEIKGKAGILAAVKGVCPHCGTTVFRIVGKKK